MFFCSVDKLKYLHHWLTHSHMNMVTHTHTQGLETMEQHGKASQNLINGG